MADKEKPKLDLKALDAMIIKVLAYKPPKKRGVSKDTPH